ncbi:MAG: hypothetical protein ACLFWL_14200 [Candidatus Brocadiia bacterium]
MAKDAEVLVEQLDSFDAGERRSALEELARRARAGAIERQEPEGWINLHSHTFFSYNGYGYSPSRFAWEAWHRGLEVAGIVDFDVLDGTTEFLEAGRLLGLKTTAGFETRVFIPEYSDRVINSPKEPGVYYLVGTGFATPPEPGTEAAGTLQDMKRRAQERNREMMRKINEYLGGVQLDYEEDIVPLTAAGNVTERHMVTAYESKARDVFEEEDQLVPFWADKLGEPESGVRALLDDIPGLKSLIRSKLMKHGGVGYAQPDAGSFPTLEKVNDLTLSCDAVPSGCWLDGTSAGEKDPLEHFGFLRDKGCATITIIPDRNWNVPEDEREMKVLKLNEAIEAAKELRMPILVGTEMNKYGNRFVDDFSSDALAPHLGTFRRGAHILWGHTLLRMTAGVGYTGEWADAHFRNQTGEKNEFFRRIGAFDYPGEETMAALEKMNEDASPSDFEHLIWKDQETNQ